MYEVHWWVLVCTSRALKDCSSQLWRFWKDYRYLKLVLWCLPDPKIEFAVRVGGVRSSTGYAERQDSFWAKCRGGNSPWSFWTFESGLSNCQEYLFCNLVPLELLWGRKRRRGQSCDIGIWYFHKWEDVNIFTRFEVKQRHSLRSRWQLCFKLKVYLLESPSLLLSRSCFHWCFFFFLGALNCDIVHSISK